MDRGYQNVQIQSSTFNLHASKEMAPLTATPNGVGSTPLGGPQG